MPLQSFLLSIFAPHRSLAYDFQSTRDRNSALCIIMVNIGLIPNLTILSTTMFLYRNDLTSLAILLMGYSLLGASLLFLRKKNDKVAAHLPICYLHMILFVLSHHINLPLILLCAIHTIPNTCFLVNLPTKASLFSALLCGIQFGFNILQVQEIFRISLDNEQSYQIFTLLISTGIYLSHATLVCFARKSNEEAVWQFAQVNISKSESLTKEIMNVVESKNALVFSVSQEIKDSLSSTQQNLNYLLQVAKKHKHLALIQNIKLNIEMTHNMISNIADVCRFRQDQMDNSNAPHTLSQILEKVFTIQTVSMQKKNITIQALICKNLPKKLWTDASRLSQIINNLISNALKYTQANGEINVYATWCS